MSETPSKIRFLQVNLVTIFLLFILILAGGVVRSTGSGMGCPDWPKCFGQYIPPTSITDLPKDYKKSYVKNRLVKNIRFANALDFFGLADLSRRIRNDKSILVPEEFNAVKTWTEYVNRVIGAACGFMLLLTAYYALSYKTENILIAFLSFANVVIVVVQAWLGAIVVSTNLVPVIVTVHMLIALAIVAISIYTLYLAKVYGKPVLKVTLLLRFTAAVALAVTVFQIIFGTAVRQKIDAVAIRLQEDYREDWISNIGSVFYQHRTIGIVVFFVNILLFILIRNYFNKHSVQQQLMSFSLLVVMLQVVSGIALSYWALPPVAQAAHVFLSSLLFGSQFFLFLNLFKSVNYAEVRI